MRTEHLGPTHVRDVFSGQVLSLHPLSGFFMKDPGLCAIAGRFFGSEAYEQALVRGDAESCREYWGLLGAILSAAHEYRQAWESYDQQRGQHVTADAAAVVQGQGAVSSGAGMVTDFARAQRIRCADCGHELQCLRFYPAEEEAVQFQAEFRCSHCAREQSVMICEDTFRQWL